MRPDRYFVFLYVEDAFLSNMLNAAIFALDPSERWPAHVTLAGPFNSRRAVPRKLDFARRVSVIGVNQFRSDKQNTVHFRVGAQGMRDVWKKPDYPFNPHLTLYNGSNHGLGDELYSQLCLLRPIFKFDVTMLNIVTSVAQRNFDLLSTIDLDFSPKLRGMRLEDLRQLNDDERIDVAVESVKRAVAYCAKFN